MSGEGDQPYNDSNWMFAYVLLCLVPVAFVSIALYSAWRGKAAGQGQRDIEMGIQNQRVESPWRGAMEWPGRPTAGPGPLSGNFQRTDEHAKRELPGSGSRQSQDFQDVPLDRNHGHPS
ncbi:hypothetical protein GGR54DRAFT_638612 [Hypoxylon sp. NC1633]|nr:hypothetical protein GGR54DRAFT_638612 [Hypoxylon sp. NC1633]